MGNCRTNFAQLGYSSAPRASATEFDASAVGYAGRPVINKTNLNGLYDFRLQFSGEALSGNPDAAGPSIFTAIQEQLGLRLEPSKGPVDVLVIDHVERPSEN